MKGWRRNHGDWTGQEISLSLEAANYELLKHVRATADPSLPLSAIMAMNSPVIGRLDAQLADAGDSLLDLEPDVHAAQAEELSSMLPGVLEAAGVLQNASRTLAPLNGQMCAVFAVDIVGFTRPDRDDDIRRYLHEQLYELLVQAFDGSGIPWEECFHEDRGDGALIIVPPHVACAGIIDPLPERLRGLVRRHNHVSCQAAEIQLRVAAHIGPVEHDGHGFVGSDINLLFHMLEARPLKHALAGSGAELALMVSEDVYRSLVCRCPSLVSPEAFQQVRFQVRQTRGRAWTYIPGYAAAAAGG